MSSNKAVVKSSAMDGEMLDFAIGKAVKVIHEALEDNVSSVRFYSI
jgi:hypothetical protein